MPRFFRSRRAWLVLVAVLIAGTTAGAILRSRRGPATVVQTEEVRRGEVVETVSATGRVQPQSEVKISANVSGRIEHLPVKEGEAVAAGQLLVEIDPTRYDAAVNETEAALRSARADVRLAAANLEQAARDLERRRQMRAQNLASAGELESTETAHKVAEARLDAAREAVHRAEALLVQVRDDRSKTTIAAPMAGVLTRVNVEVGEMVLGTAQNVGTTIMTLADLERMEVLTEVDESEVVKVALGDTASIEVDAISNRTFQGLVSEIAHSATTRGRGTAEEATHFEIKVAFLGDVSVLRPGMSATVDIRTERRPDAIHVPIQCVTLRAKPGEGPAGADARKGKKGKKARGEAIADDREGPPGGGGGEGERGGGRRAPVASNLRQVVFVVRDGVAREVAVETGISSPTEIEIIGGELRENDEVVSGNYRILSRELEDGDGVRVDNTSLRRARRGGGPEGTGERSDAGGRGS
jgi:HlyD family secretion protein